MVSKIERIFLNGYAFKRMMEKSEHECKKSKLKKETT